jgi:sugar phosphate isomerase/epimerase
MRIGNADLTYCSNIHAAEGWPAVFDTIRGHTVELKRRLSPDAAFGLGLRLSNEEALQLLQEDRLEEFAQFLEAEGLYVALINGFPYGWFHGRKLKDQVFAPDWQDDERAEYTIRLIRILSRLLPHGMDGGISTCPLSYKPWSRSQGPPDWDLIIDNLLRVVESMLDARRIHAKSIHLDIEPEPDGLIENTAEFLAFFARLLRIGVPRLAQACQLTTEEAETALREHVTLCYDLCHFAVEHETAEATLRQIQAAGVRIGRVQISSAVQVDLPKTAEGRSELREHLQAFVDPVYLHQIIGDQGRYPDLVEGLAHLETAPCSEWRIHYHVPLFLEKYGALSSTQMEVQAALQQLAPLNLKHFEIETYTWGVLPPELKLDVVDSIEREYRWVLKHL